MILVHELGDEAVRTLVHEVSSSSSTLSLALNLIMSYELSYEQKASFKKSLIKNNPFYFNYESNEIKTHILINQLFYDIHYLRITSWQVRVILHELKHLTSSGNEVVYCVVDIGGHKFKSKETQIDNLNFENDKQVFIARIENEDYQKAFNYLITIEVKIILVLLLKRKNYSFGHIS